MNFAALISCQINEIMKILQKMCLTNEFEWLGANQSFFLGAVEVNTVSII